MKESKITYRKKAMIAVIAVAIIGLIGTLSYAFFTTMVDNSQATQANLSTGTMALTFADNDNGINEKLMFGESVMKKFTIENTGTLETSLSLDWYDLINTYTLGSLTYKLEWSESETGTYQTLIDTTNVPVSSEAFTLPISSEISVPAGTKYYYNLIITLENLEAIDQTGDLDAIFQTKFTVNQPSKYRYYTLEVDPNGGTWGTYTAAQTYQLKNDETKSIPDPTKVGYTFAGWSITSLAGELSNNTFSMGISNAKLVANWQVNKYTLTIDTDGGTYSGNTTIELEYLSSTELASNPTREGYTFTGWDVEGGELSDTTFTLTEAQNATLTATWQINNYKYIVYHYQQSVDGSEYTLVDGDTDEGEATYNSTVTPERKTYTGFTSPSGTSLTIKAETTYPPVLNKVDYNYIRNKYTLTVNVGNGAYTGESIPSDGIYYESSVDLGTPTNPTGYTFVNWSATSGSITDNTYKMSSATNDTVTANYTANEYSITFNANGGSVDTQSKTVTYDSTYGTLPTPTHTLSYYEFNGWYTTQTGGTQITSATTVSITADQTLYAQWKRNTVKYIQSLANAESPDFGTIATTDEGIFTMEDNYGTSYYYRGAVENNYLEFAGFYWRIIRLNGDGTIRLLYDGQQLYENGATDSDRFALTEIPWNVDNKDDAKYAGYMYGGINGEASESKEEAQANNTSSNVKTQLEEWYRLNLANTTYNSAIADVIFCNDRTTAETAGIWHEIDTALGFGANYTNFGAFSRLKNNTGNTALTNPVPTFICTRKNDAFTMNDEITGNGKLTYPVGLITADEIQAAGGLFGLENPNTYYYLYKGARYWSMSPTHIGASGMRIFNVNYDGHLGDEPVTSNSSAVVPVINLKREYIEQMIGTGTMEDPYRLS